MKNPPAPNEPIAQNIQSLRGFLFEQLEILGKEKLAPIDIDRAKAATDVAQTIINSAKVEVEMTKALGNVKLTNFVGESEVIEVREPGKGGLTYGDILPPGSDKEHPPGTPGVTRHSSNGKTT